MSVEKRPYRLQGAVIHAGRLRPAGDVVLLSEADAAGYAHLLQAAPGVEPSPAPPPAIPDPRDVDLARLRPLAERLADENRALRQQIAALKTPPDTA